MRATRLYTCYYSIFVLRVNMAIWYLLRYTEMEKDRSDRPASVACLSGRQGRQASACSTPYHAILANGAIRYSQRESRYKRFFVYHYISCAPGYIIFLRARLLPAFPHFFHIDAGIPDFGIILCLSVRGLMLCCA